jgi:hypothetical protein
MLRTTTGPTGSCSWVAVIVSCCILAATTDAAGVNDASRVADRVLEAMAAGRAVASLHIDECCDPWLVVEELCVRGAQPAAVAVATESSDAEALATYARGRTCDQRDQVAMSALKSAERLWMANAPTHAVEVLGKVRATEGTVLNAFRAYLEGVCLHDAGRTREAEHSLLAAGRCAARIAWRELRDRALLPMAMTAMFEQVSTGGESAGLRRRLGVDETLCVYLVVDADLLAVVMTREESSCIPLGSTTDAERTLAPWAHIRPEEAMDRTLKESRRLLIRALGLSENGATVFVVWPQDVGVVPFCALVTGRPTVRLRRVTDLVRLRNDEAMRRRTGTKVLEVRGPTPAVRSRIGDVTLEDCTVLELRDAMGAQRWAAVHFSCPLVSVGGLRSLGLREYKPGMNEEAALLGPIQFGSMRPDADLVTFGADLEDETAVWVGALLADKTPRILACQWRQDEAATAELMRALYARWKGAGGPISAGTALMEAQSEVAKKPEYAHPYYWAGWQLWGLP